MTVYILGGGPAGLALAYKLSKADVPFVLFENNDVLGGMARTLKWRNYGSHDLGPHKIFTLNKNLEKEVESILSKEDWLVRKKISSIFMKGHFLSYPPSPFSLIKVYGLPKFFTLVVTYLWAIVMNILKISKFSPNNSFEDNLKNRVGSGLYTNIFKPIATKLWLDPKLLDQKLAQNRVQTPSIWEIILSLIGKKKKNSNFEAENFKYPRTGLNKLWKTIREECKNTGVFNLNQEVKKITMSKNTILSFEIEDKINKTNKTVALGVNDFVFSTIPLLQIMGMLKNSLSENIVNEARKIVKLNDLIIVFLMIKEKNLFDESWIFIPDAEISFHRISEQESFDPGMVSNGSIIMCEIMENGSKGLGQKSDKDILSIVDADLKKLGYKYNLIDYKVERLKESYPVYLKGFEPILKNTLGELDKIDNFKTIGRQGAFNYIGTLDAMDIGFGAADWYLHNSKQKNHLEFWQKERLRTENFPVLD